MQNTKSSCHHLKGQSDTAYVELYTCQVDVMYPHPEIQLYIYRGVAYNNAHNATMHPLTTQVMEG